MDTCFVIDWVRFSKREIIFEVFDLLYITTDALDELKSEEGIRWISDNVILE